MRLRIRPGRQEHQEETQLLKKSTTGRPASVRMLQRDGTTKRIHPPIPASPKPRDHQPVDGDLAGLTLLLWKMCLVCQKSKHISRGKWNWNALFRELISVRDCSTLSWVQVTIQLPEFEEPRGSHCI